MARLRTEIPGPRSREPTVRREGAVAAGVASVLPVFADQAEPGLLVDAAGNRLIDFGSVVVPTCGTRGNVIRLLPPLVIPDERPAEGLDAREGAIE